MRANDRSILIGLLILGLLAVFWFMLLAPKRERASELDGQISEVQSELEDKEQLASAAEQARGDYAKNYGRLVALGKAAPADGDTPSLLAQLTDLAERSRTDFGSLTVGGAGESVTPPAAPAETTTDPGAEEGGEDEEASGDAAQPALATAAPATEASAATLPLGAAIGPAGLGVLPYTLNFSGDFFQVADLLGRLDAQVASGNRTMAVDGRLMTVNGFSLAPSTTGGDELNVELSVSTYVLPESQGLTAGATQAAPAATVPASTPTTTTPAP